jgi:hypothetical protein
LALYDIFLKDFVEKHTKFFCIRGKVIPWATATMLFFSLKQLRGRKPFEVTLARIQEVVQLASSFEIQ